MMLTYHSVAELYEALDRTRERLRRSLEGLGAEAEGFRDAPERWTIAEIVEHLSLVEGSIARLASKILEKVESGGASPAGVAAGDGRRSPLVDFGAIAERAAQEKYAAPEKAVPKGGVTLSDSLARLDDSSDTLRALRPRIETLDLSAARFPHPAFGPLDLYQWLAVLSLHEERHRQQIESLKDSLARRTQAQP